MDDDTFDEFLQDATLAVSYEWEYAGGAELSTQELYDLNDVLTALFSGKRERATE